MRILVAGATGSIGIHVVNTAIAMGHQPVALVRNRRKIKLLPRGTDIFYGDVSIPETLTDLPKDIDAIIFTLGSDGQGRIGARAIDYGGVRNILRIFMDTPVRIALVSSNAAVAFLGTTVTSNDDTLALQSSAAGSAQNVGIQILDRTGEVLVLDGATFSAKTDLIDGTNILPFQARYIALGQSVAGTANADATFKVQYL